MVQQTTREEIETHIQALNVIWKAYDDIEKGKTFASVSKLAKERQKDALNQRFREEAAWLRNHGVPDWALDYDKDTKTYCLPIDWTLLLGSCSDLSPGDVS